MAQPNTNCLDGMRCPKCGAYEPFAIEIRMTVSITDDGFEWPRSEDNNPYWDEDSPCRCEECDYDGDVRDFNVKE